MSSLSTIPDAIQALRLGRAVIVIDDEDRENEGDVVFAAATATPEQVAWVVRYSSGFICAPMTDEIADSLNLWPMVPANEDPRGTAYTVTVDAADRLSTGISAADRAHTLRKLADPASSPASFTRPGHILPLRAVAGGTAERNGHTEAAVDLVRLAGHRPVAAIAEITADSGEMMRANELLAFGAEHNVPVVSIADLLTYLDEVE